MTDTKTVSFERVGEGAWEKVAQSIPFGAVAALENVSREIAAAKELAEIAEVMRSILEIGDIQAVTPESLADSLTSRSGGGLQLGVPGGEPRNEAPEGFGGLPGSTHRTERHRYKPNLSIGKGGFASQSGGGGRPANIGSPTGGAYGTISRGEDGTTVVTRTEKYSSGTTITSSVTYDADGNTTRVDSQTTNPDGSTNGSGVVQTENGGWIEYEVDADKEGNVTRDEMREFDANGDRVKDNDLAGQPGSEAGSDSDLVDYLQSWHRAVYGPKKFEIKVPVYVNPGTPENADSGPSGPRLKHEGIAVNPDPNKAPGGGTINEAAARERMQQLRDKAAGGFGPGPKPPKD